MPNIRTGVPLLPSKHWVYCDMGDCLPVGTPVVLHGTRMREVTERSSVKDMLFQVLVTCSTLVAPYMTIAQVLINTS